MLSVSGKDIQIRPSNIWHLVAIKPYKNPAFSKEDQEEQDLNPYQDLQTLARRMDHFLGLSCKEETIETGLYRLNFPEFPLKKKKLEDYNEKIKELSKDRGSLRKKWQNSLILGSFVGSFMLSNQMRGRAIRIWQGHPDKTQ